MRSDLSIDETCARLNLAASTVVKLCREGVLVGAYQGAEGEWFVPESAVTQHLAKVAENEARQIPITQRIGGWMTRKRLIAILVGLLSLGMMLLNLALQNG